MIGKTEVFCQMLIPVVVALYIPAKYIVNKKNLFFVVVFFINNQTVFTILNKKYSKSHRVTSLVRILVLLQNII